MIINRLIVKNWRNFRHIDVRLQERQFIVGPNASGKSNLLDIFRFLRDIAKADGGGLQKAVGDRGGASEIRSFSAKRDSKTAIEISLGAHPDALETWRYSLGFCEEARGHTHAYLTHERVWKDGKLLVDRPDAADKADAERLTQTCLEQIHVNAKFRSIARFLQNVTYLHLVPQFLRFADSIQGSVIEGDPFGQAFLKSVASIPEKIRCSRLKKIEEALKIAIPQFECLEFIRDEHTGHPHLQARYANWHPDAAGHREHQFSDGMLRLIGLFWALLERDSVILLEEPELSLNPGIVSTVAPLIAGMQYSRHSQALVSTHSTSLLAEQGIDGTEVLILTPGKAGTEVQVASDIDHVRVLLQAGLTAGEVVLSGMAPKRAERLSLLEWD